MYNDYAKIDQGMIEIKKKEKIKKKKQTKFKGSKYDDLPATVFRKSDSNTVRLSNQNFLLHTAHRQACSSNLAPLH